MTASPDPLRRLARERGTILAELGVRPEDDRWARQEAEALASLVSPTLPLRSLARVRRLVGRIRRALR